MIVLRAIGNFFIRIWKWIKETAWVQPLLIVGLIFGIIFSIPSIVKGFESLADKINSSETYYHNFQISLVDGEKSKADQLVENILDVQESSGTSKYGDKFFLAFVSDSCATCKSAKEGFETLQNNFDKYVKDTSVPFKMYTIFADEVTSDTTTIKSAFVQFLDRQAYFFEQAAGAGEASQYFLNNKLNESDLEALASADEDDFLTPTILLIDYTDEAHGISEVMFSVSGDNKAQKAELLADCWQHTGDFAMKE